jgi:hypothetical protein
MLVKNPKGRIVSVSEEFGAYLLDPKPVLMRRDGKPKTDLDGNTFPLVKAEHEKGFTLPSKAEIAAYEKEEEEGREGAENEQALRDAGARAIAGAALLANNAAKTSIKKKVKAAPQADPVEDEATVRDAEGDAKKYNALSDTQKELYIELFTDAPEGAE